MAISKAVIAESLCNNININKPDAKDFVDYFFEEIRFALENGQHVKISGFGNFILRDKAQRPGRNPKTGQRVPVAARRVVTFRTGLKLKNKIKPRAHKES